MTFGRPTPEERQADNAARKAANLQALATVPARCLSRGTYSGGTTAAVPKEEPLRSEAYRRLVAAMPCACCGRPGPSQCAHSNTGKGMAIKASDAESFPLCPRCHRDLDQGAAFTKEERRALEQQWSAQTRAAIRVAGHWPKNFPSQEQA